jgi:hypothetical protein
MLFQWQLMLITTLWIWLCRWPPCLSIHSYSREEKNVITSCFISLRIIRILNPLLNSLFSVISNDRTHFVCLTSDVARKAVGWYGKSRRRGRARCAGNVWPHMKFEDKLPRWAALPYCPSPSIMVFERSHHVVYRFDTYLLYINIIIQTTVKTQLWVRMLYTATCFDL